MAATQLQHVKHTPRTLSLGTITELLDSLYAALSDVNDYDGVPIPNPVTVNREQLLAVTENVYWKYADGVANHFGMMFGSTVTVPAGSTLRSPDAGATNIPYVGCGKLAGTYNTWTNALPYGVGSTWSGGWRVGSLQTGGRLDVYSSAETVWALISASSGTSIAGMATGALIDTGTTVAPCGDANQTLLGMWNSGTSGGGAFGVDFVTTVFGSAAPFPAHDAVASSFHHMYFNGGAAITASEVAQRASYATHHNTSTRRNKNGDMASYPIEIAITSGGSVNRTLGRAREVYQTVDALNGQILQVGGVDVGYFVGARETTTSSTYLLGA